MIPKANGTLRRLGIPTAADRVVQGVLKLVLEPFFEADFKPCSCGFRPRRRAQDAIAEFHHLASRGYTWVVDAGIKACFEEIDHGALMQRLRRRVGDKRILCLIKAFLKAGLLSEDGQAKETITGTPQGGILSPLLANIALASLDEHFTQQWEALGPDWKRANWRRAGHATAKLVRNADDFVILVHGTREHALALRDQAAANHPDGPAPLEREDQDLPHRRRLRLPWVAHPTPPQARPRPPEGDLHHPITQATHLADEEGPVAHPTGSAEDARRPPAPTQPGATRDCAP